MDLERSHSCSASPPLMTPGLNLIAVSVWLISIVEPPVDLFYEFEE